MNLSIEELVAHAIAPEMERAIREREQKAPVRKPEVRSVLRRIKELVDLPAALK